MVLTLINVVNTYSVAYLGPKLKDVLVQCEVAAGDVLVAMTP